MHFDIKDGKIRIQHDVRHCAIKSLPKKSQSFTKLSKFSKADLGTLIFAECLREQAP